MGVSWSRTQTRRHLETQPLVFCGVGWAWCLRLGGGEGGLGAPALEERGAFASCTSLDGGVQTSASQPPGHPGFPSLTLRISHPPPSCLSPSKTWGTSLCRRLPFVCLCVFTLFVPPCGFEGEEGERCAPPPPSRGTGGTGPFSLHCDCPPRTGTSRVRGRDLHPHASRPAGPAPWVELPRSREGTWRRPRRDTGTMPQGPVTPRAWSGVLPKA